MNFMSIANELPPQESILLRKLTLNEMKNVTASKVISVDFLQTSHRTIHPPSKPVSKILHFREFPDQIEVLPHNI